MAENYNSDNVGYCDYAANQVTVIYTKNFLLVIKRLILYKKIMRTNKI